MLQARISAGAVLAALVAVAPALSEPRRHVLEPGPKTVHIGFFDAALEPVLRIDSGDIVSLKTASGNPRYYEALGVPRERIPQELYAIYEGAEGSGRSDHTLTGPIYVNGAEPGDTLEIRIREIELWLPIAGQGFVPGRGVLPDEFPYARDQVHWIDLEKKTVTYPSGAVIPLAPFWGVIGVAPPASMGRVSSGPPNIFGGNMDNRDLRPGTSLFLPVHVPGALLSLGDGHAAQGYGEVCLSAVETSLQGEIEVLVHKKRLRWPRAETETHYISMGLHTDLDEAVQLATREMLDFVVETKGIPREEAYLLLSASMDLVVTQAVDGTKGVHGLLPKSIFRGQ
jgi:acetamidase/formamidase